MPRTVAPRRSPRAARAAALSFPEAVRHRRDGVDRMSWWRWSRRSRAGTRAARSSLQLLLQLGQEPPVGTLRDERLRRRLDHPRLAQAQGIEADGVLRIVDAPLVVGNILHGLERIVVARREAAIHEGPRGPLRFEGAEVGSFQGGP